MTTITNFLQHSFTTRELTSIQTPIWVISIPKKNQYNYKILRNQIIDHAIQNKKILMHLDLGISQLHQQTKKQAIIYNQTPIIKPNENAQYYLIKNKMMDKFESEYLSKLMGNIKDIISGKCVTLSDQIKTPISVSFLIQGLHLYSILNSSYHQYLISWINQLSTLKVGQITILVADWLMIDKTINYTLQKISTCLSYLNNFTILQPQAYKWQCQSTVRRITGHYKEQSYIISSKSNKFKVTKKEKVKCKEQETQAQKQLVSSLGFVVKNDIKGNNNTQQQYESQLKKMIYPHLRQQQCENCKQPTNCKCSDDNNLIVLDDEQQDDDDIDV